MSRDHRADVVVRDRRRGNRRRREGKQGERVGERSRVARRGEDAGAWGHHLLQPADPRGDHRPAERERLDGDEAEALPPAGDRDRMRRGDAGVQLGAGQGLDECDGLSETEVPALCFERGPLRSGTDDLERDVDAAAPSDRDCVDQHVEPLLGGESARCDETPRGALREWLQRCVDDHGHPHHTTPRWVEAEGHARVPPTTALRPRRRSRLETAPRDRARGRSCARRSRHRCRGA